MNNQGQKLRILKVRLFRPFDIKALIEAIRHQLKDCRSGQNKRTALEPLYEDIRTAVGEFMQTNKTRFSSYPTIIGGRYGLGSAEFTPAMVKAIYDELGKDVPKNHFTIGINDDVTGSSIDYDHSFSIEPNDVFRALFYGLGSDGTVSANKNSIKIISDKTDYYTQGYFVYDSKKAGTVTVSHLRFGKKEIRSPYLVNKAQFIACHNFSFVEKVNMVKNLMEGGVFLLESPYDKDTVWDKLPGFLQKQLIEKKARFFVIDAIDIAQKIGLGGRINTIMQTAFFQISKVIDDKVAIDSIKYAIKTYGKKVMILLI